MSIRFKVILPYLLLTFLVAVIGVYVVTELVTNSLSERLTNQLLEAGRVVSDDLVREEIRHVDAARNIAYTRGVAEAIVEKNDLKLRELTLPVASVQNIEVFFIFGVRGDEEFHAIRRPDNGFAEFHGKTSETLQKTALDILSENDLDALPRRVLAINPVDSKYYYFTALPVPLENNVVGVVFVGTSLNTLLPYFKNTSLANIIIYHENGEVIGTTFEAENDSPLFVSSLNITKELSQEVRLAEELVYGENILIDGRSYRLARGALRVGIDHLCDHMRSELVVPY